MRIPTFTFKNEAIWLLLLSLAPLTIALIIILVSSLTRILQG